MTHNQLRIVLDTNVLVSRLLAARSTPRLRHVRVCRDPSDDKFLEVAINGEADMIVTGDRDLLAVHPFMGIPMNTTSIPSLRVAPELRSAAESVLRDGESLSSFVAASIRAQIDFRRAQQEFVARGLASRAESRKTGEYFSANTVLAELEGMLDKALQNREKSGP